MTQTVPADFLGKEDLGYAYLAFLSNNASQQIVDLLQELRDELPGVIWPMPRNQLHITLCEIIRSTKVYPEGKEALFKLHEQDYLDSPSSLFADIPKQQIVLDTIEVSPEAIIVRSSESGAFNDIRASLAASIPLPSETKLPNIIHSSIGRFLSEIELERVQEAVSQRSINIHEEITQFHLVKATKLPLESYEILKSYPLGGQD